MRVITVATVLSLLLVAGPVVAQTAQPEAQAPAQQAQAAPQPPRPFPQGAKVAYINIQQIANDTALGRASTARVQALNEQKVAELQDKNKALQAAQQKLQQSLSVLNDTARQQLEKEVERLQVEIQRATQDAQAEVRDLQEELQADFQRKLMPIIGQVAAEMNLHMLFSQLDAGLVWADPGLDITADVIKRFDAANPASGAPASGSTSPPPQP